MGLGFSVVYYVRAYKQKCVKEKEIVFIELEMRQFQ